MHLVEVSEVQIATIHHVEGARLHGQEVSTLTSPIFPSLMWMSDMF